MKPIVKRGVRKPTHEELFGKEHFPGKPDYVQHMQGRLDRGEITPGEILRARGALQGAIRRARGEAKETKPVLEQEKRDLESLLQSIPDNESIHRYQADFKSSSPDVRAEALLHLNRHQYIPDSVKIKICTERLANDPAGEVKATAIHFLSFHRVVESIPLIEKAREGAGPFLRGVIEVNLPILYSAKRRR